MLYTHALYPLCVITTCVQEYFPGLRNYTVGPNPGPANYSAWLTYNVASGNPAIFLPVKNQVSLQGGRTR